MKQNQIALIDFYYLYHVHVVELIRLIHFHKLISSTIAIISSSLSVFPTAPIHHFHIFQWLDDLAFRVLYNYNKTKFIIEKALKHLTIYLKNTLYNIIMKNSLQ